MTVDTAKSTYATIGEVRQAIESGRATASGIAEAALARIDAEDGVIHSFLSVSRERAMASAEKIDAAARSGNDLPPLAGVPVGIKDVLTIEGLPATAGSKILEGYLPPYTATSVRKLEEAGAVVLGKLNCDEFAMGSSNENSAYGPVKNPRALDRVPGGSSGGSAAAVAAGMSVATLGTDTGGSIRQPASFCGVVGMLPTYGRVSRYGLIAFASSLDRVGPFTNTVRDAATVLGVIAGHDPLDATSSPLPVPDYTADLDRGVNGMKIGVPAEYFAEGLDQEVRAAVEAVIDRLKTHGAEIRPISLPHTRYAVPTYYVLATAEASANLARFDGVRYGHRSAEANTLSAMYRRSREEGFGAEVKRRIMLGTYVLSAGYYDAYYKKAQQVRRLLTNDFIAAFADVDAIVTPTAPTPAFKLGEKTDDPLAMYLADIYTVTANLAGICGISIPCGQSSEGLPIGVQILGRHFDEATVFQVGHAIEKAD
ncbi:Asp-tRNA(Asn)/Glu-tRNA(Gln) amidotransferase subunit GatA [Acidipila rosea]|uniref:Glutamyl-tRNA(Gln) amidotransferase subunit A n=1 Tax=Acidipila rosea TaxID=768535 RepID=A0A4R1KZA7_9BACT|nr:Asp-tRNA(Asn)/Glu-tRNA(Gln) amidotransferase subunit GatA [Acidipila rosea]MBW4028368.1 Asp-tRNA(Asn)/Glu-tRNA(Gln) amidotransferase subunit GatA [Acidobacteriota bacterium]MBW4046272.1 Asp-tRNA(Asn)/Glu-tRNA(Gln) amidotransferase subunit GatA [Acidobacteriota bacterium]TCK70834.1 aspartyl/glutamyl-tRNA(Asn/Gln) amidotransferase subunit A [Acidipila rosea]